MAQSNTPGYFVRFFGNICKSSVKWYLGANDGLSSAESQKYKEKKRNKNMTCWIIREQREGSECTVEHLVVTGEIQRGANKELVRVGRWLVDCVIYEGKERRRFPETRGA